MATLEDFLALDIRVGTVCVARVHPSAKKPAYQLEIDFGEWGVKHSSAQLTTLYSAEELVGRQVVAVVNFPARRIGGFVSEVLVLGALGEGQEVVLLTTERPVQPGARIG